MCLMWGTNWGLYPQKTTFFIVAAVNASNLWRPSFVSTAVAETLFTQPLQPPIYRPLSALFIAAISLQFPFSWLSTSTPHGPRLHFNRGQCCQFEITHTNVRNEVSRIAPACQRTQQSMRREVTLCRPVIGGRWTHAVFTGWSVLQLASKHERLSSCISASRAAQS
jgi:hypothetical protein